MFIDTEKSPLAKKIPSKTQLSSHVATGLPLLQLWGQPAPRPLGPAVLSSPTDSEGNAASTQHSPGLCKSKPPL